MVRLAALLLLFALTLPLSASADPTLRLAEAQSHYQALDYDKVLPIVEELLALPNLDLELKLDIYLLQAKALAVVGDPVDAQQPFRLLLRARPDFDLDERTPPKILAVFRKVQAEERIMAEQLATLQRKRTLQLLKLEGELPEAGRGGLPLDFKLRLTDPTGVVEGVEIPYRKTGETGWSVLALERGNGGLWSGRLSGEWTSNSSGLEMEFYVSSHDISGPLLTLGSAESPILLTLAAGKVRRSVAFVPRWLWWTLAGISVGAAGAGGAYAVVARKAQSDHDALVSGSLQGTPVDALALSQALERRDGARRARNGFLIGAGVGVVVTFSLLPFRLAPAPPAQASP